MTCPSNNSIAPPPTLHYPSYPPLLANCNSFSNYTLALLIVITTNFWKYRSDQVHQPPPSPDIKCSNGSLLPQDGLPDTVEWLIGPHLLLQPPLSPCCCHTCLSVPGPVSFSPKCICTCGSPCLEINRLSCPLC